VGQSHVPNWLLPFPYFIHHNHFKISLLFQARHQEYKDPAEEEWTRFQKEIAQELSAAQEAVAEEQVEATEDRQLEEVEDQMRAWEK